MDIWRQCRECKGGGVITHDHWSRNPELEVDLLCDACNGHGQVMCRNAIYDPLTTLGANRRAIGLLKGRDPLLLNSARRWYRRSFETAFRPVSLPGGSR